ncbi:MAG TPA: hypothetical protein PKA06_08025 [Gemmatales bacterium]|nr:hypothetical protein [Gemmatales bacterium]HMP17370.1 hypothetical protein [Gemmatales bacterium]
MNLMLTVTPKGTTRIPANEYLLVTIGINQRCRLTVSVGIMVLFDVFFAEQPQLELQLPTRQRNTACTA